MKFCIREWSENSVVLMTQSGHVLAYFSSVSDALDVCSQWYGSQAGELKCNVDVWYRENNIKKPASVAVA
ncbi:hypothetical protein MNBD_GAMMA08-1316 [hydrothermal vent metagenome]|uniref:Uncharacterized protein n=1 Tax=hydrothermal vent metagenome TaxID=652676 RepID=A0A3B0XVJ5_9ZZZZ